jgi:NADP-dependent 3-hydroxy acid dehydrogenase YdfG
MQPLRDQVALITGASSGIGQAIALALAQSGATVCLLARNRDALLAVQKQIPTPSHLFPCDLADDTQINNLPAQLEKEAAPIDILIHSAATYFQEPLESAPVDHFDLQYRINLRAPYLLTQKFLPQLKRQPGQVLFINSSTGVSARPGVTQYAAVKHGLKGLADAFRAEIAPAGIRVISIYPGQTATPMQQRRHELEHRDYHPEKLIQPQDIASAVLNAITLPRNATITDLHIRPSPN